MISKILSAAVIIYVVSIAMILVGEMMHLDILAIVGGIGALLTVILIIAVALYLFLN